MENVSHSYGLVFDLIHLEKNKEKHIPKEIFFIVIEEFVLLVQVMK